MQVVTRFIPGFFYPVRLSCPLQLDAGRAGYEHRGNPGSCV